MTLCEYMEANNINVRAISALIEVPPSHVEAICTNAIEISDTFWRMSFERHGTITDAFFEEGMRAVVGYLRTYLPEVLTPRDA